jgi:hypothetical protein
MSYRLPMTLCPKCGYAMDAHTYALDGDREVKPRPGDIGVCFGCFEPLIFGDDLKLRAPKPGEVEEMPEDLVIKLQFIQTVRKITEMNKPKTRARVQ